MDRNLVVLGSTGSIGRQTLDVVRGLGGAIRVYGLAARRSIDVLCAQAAEFAPETIVVGDGEARVHVEGVEVLRGEEGMVALVSRPEVDLVVVGTSGAAGLAPTLAALRAGKMVALANKETLVMAGQVIKQAMAEAGGRLVPIDSEHSAIWQCLQGEEHSSIETLTLTASGGALRSLSPSQLVDVTPEQVLQHPTWSMGPKITVDSANLMNKGLEVLEATWLFDVGLERVAVVLHPQSIVHSFVTFHDGSVKAQLGLPDMRLPIQYALSHPARWPAPLARLDLPSVGELTFASVDMERYPALRLALEAGKRGGTYPTVLCAADEVVVEAFLQRRVPFARIPEIVERVLDGHVGCSAPELADILESDRWARSQATMLAAR